MYWQEGDKTHGACPKDLAWILSTAAQANIKMSSTNALVAEEWHRNIPRIQTGWNPIKLSRRINSIARMQPWASNMTRYSHRAATIAQL